MNLTILHSYAFILPFCVLSFPQLVFQQNQIDASCPRPPSIFSLCFCRCPPVDIFTPEIAFPMDNSDSKVLQQILGLVPDSFRVCVCGQIGGNF